ncbi:unnamed protein product [Rotaria sp. Silwood1]|nr:unnamed protein product [Rotaria sp. Silwood1]CAF0744258.1 unnamed protein product [Rotaria sp. Silwood1]CAF3355198.1 unnamed protein product [Rotaria sp. Silwood1]CAF4531117.1 unnamed protein product [Rotaria sp. Silwood1]CAF4887153.1 unnamed protein product [Rotaria sp. Silwood1]
MEYVTIKDPFKESTRFNFNEAAYKNKQIMSKSSKQRSTGSLAGYFDTEFKLLSGSYIDPISMRRKARIEEKKKNIVNKPFISMYRPKDPEGLGSFYGTIGGAVKDLDPSKAKYRAQAKPPSEKSNFKVNPSKKGTGYGYANVGIDKDPPYAYKEKTDNYDASLNAQRKDYIQHKSQMKAGVFKLNMHPTEYFDRNPYRDDGKSRKSRSDARERSKSAPSDKKPFKYSSPGKSLGGNKDGCFDKFPKRSDKDPYVVGTIYAQVKNEVNKHGKTYYPNKFPKTRPTDSVIHKNIDLKITRQNYKQASQTYQGFQVPQRRASVH